MKRPKRHLPPTINRWTELRIALVGAVLICGFLGMVYKAWGLQVSNSDHFRSLAQRQHLRSIALPTPRGAIYDIRGRELAVTSDVDSVFANPREVVDLISTAKTLSELLDVDVRAVEERLASARHFAWIDRHVSPEAAAAVKAAKLPGIEITQEPRRYYPGQELAGPVLGLSNIDGEGLDGIELAMDDFLVGTRTKRTAFRAANGAIMLTGTDDSASPGANVTLTLDRFIQFATERALSKAVRTHEAKAGMAVVLDVKTSEVLALANWPTFDPNRPTGRKNARNRAITDAFEVGSVVKPLTVLGALEAGVITPDQEFNIFWGRYKVGRKVIRDSYSDKTLDVKGILKRSSNVGTIQIAQLLGKEGLMNTLKAFGMGQRSDVQLPGERSGYLLPTKRWGDIGLATVSYGYGFLATPLQIAAAYAAIGNRGLYTAPRIVKEIRDSTGDLLYEANPPSRRVVSEENAQAVLPMLAAVFDRGRDGGTARNITIDGFRAGGKTGTSYKVDPETKRYSSELYLSSFAGLAPVPDPRIAVVIFIDEPGGEEHYGSIVAGPAFAEIVSETLRYLGVPATELPAAEDDEEQEATPTPQLEPPEVPIAFSESFDPRDVLAVPDFKGLGLRKALDLAGRAGVSPEIDGSGVVTRQEPGPGPAPKDSKIRLFLERPSDGRHKKPNPDVGTP